MPPLPEAIRFPDTMEYELRHWEEILTKTVEWLNQSRILTLANVLVGMVRGSGYLINTEPVHSDGCPMVKRTQAGDRTSYGCTRSHRRRRATMRYITPSDCWRCSGRTSPKFTCCCPTVTKTRLHLRLLKLSKRSPAEQRLWQFDCPTVTLSVCAGQHLYIGWSDANRGVAPTITRP